MKRMSSLAMSSLGCLCLLAMSACGNASDAAGKYEGKTVCIDQNTTATVISDILKGIDDQLETQKDAGLNVVTENPNGDTAAEQTIAQKFINDGCDVVVPIGTAASQLMSTVIKDIPIVFAASSTPVEAKLVDSMQNPGKNVTGVADILDPAPDIDAMRKIMPEVGTVGLVWKLGDPAGEAQTKKAMKHLDSLGIEYVPASITTGSEIVQATKSLVGRADAIEIPGDNATMSAIGGLMQTADDANLPVFGGTSMVVEEGGVLSTTFDYKDVGAEVAKLAVKVVDGADPAETAVVVPEASGYDLNITKLEKLGLDIPSDIKESAITTY
ncbi:putative ABC transport system substrate-binding protein [Brevibacterium siliguriense]|uniref:Putative ABC transport system substrate-binding protein n=1 Tax=Brevibacterium siliguriense TaxID=1136497 RepID=A0A1H1QAF1_9MICO|nr:ABC transporter substrate-binding protein [Brevibacterium siliguriense]SDS20498.1 putative ABC transport system substrate-binding protein [Brevibacterium siliguriense]